MPNYTYAKFEGIYLGRTYIGRTDIRAHSQLVYTTIMVVQEDSITPPLSQAVGYVVVVGIGLAIALGMIFVTRLLKKTVGEDNEKTEMYVLIYSSCLCR